MFSFAQWIRDLVKGHGHKYIKRIPYNTPKGRRYRYIYQAHHRHKGKHVLDPSDMKEGAKFMIHGEKGKEVHAHIERRLGNTISFVYDDGPKKGQTVTMHVDGLAKLIDDAIDTRGKLEEQRSKLKRTILQAEKTGTNRQIERLKQRLEKINDQLRDRSLVLEDEAEVEVEAEVEEVIEEVDSLDDSKLSQEQRINGIDATKEEQIQRRDFKNWFKESVVVGEDGEPAEQWGARPVRVYHGTARGGFSSFSKEADQGANIFGKGFYFTSDKEIATKYTERDKKEAGSDATPEVFEVFLSLQNPIDMRKEVDETEFASLCKYIHESKLEQLEKYVENAETTFKQKKEAADLFTVLTDVNTSGQFRHFHTWGPPEINISVDEGEKIPKGYAIVRNPYSSGRENWDLIPVDDVEGVRENLETQSQWAENYFKLKAQELADSKAIIAGKKAPTISDSYIKMYSVDDYELLGDPSDPLSLERARKIKTHLKAKTAGKTYKDYLGRTMPILGGLHVEPTDKLTWQDLYYIATDGHSDRRGFTRLFREWGESTGRDGIIHTGGYSIGERDHEVFVAWEPNQIKATNAKYFNPDSTDIYNGDGVTRPEGGTGLPISTESEDNFGTMPDTETESEDNFGTMPDTETESEDNFGTMPDTETESEDKPKKPRNQRGTVGLDTPASDDKIVDVGKHVWGSRKDLSGLHRNDLSSMHPKEIVKEVKRDKLLSWRGLTAELEAGEEAGHTVSAIIMKDAIVKCVKANPFKFSTVLVDSKGNKTDVDNVADYIDACDFLMQSLDSCSTYADCVRFLQEFDYLTVGQKAKTFYDKKMADEYATQSGGTVHHVSTETDFRTNTKREKYSVVQKLDNAQTDHFKRYKQALAGETPSHTWTQRRNTRLNKILDRSHSFDGVAERDKRMLSFYEEELPKPFREAMYDALRYEGQSWESEDVQKYVRDKTEKTADSPRTKSRRRAFKWIRDVNEEVVRVGGKQAVVKADATHLHAELNLRNVQYGNWMDQESRKIHTKQCHEAFYDLADVLGIDVKQISLNGRLSIGFGARGKGKASAHYEPVSNIINLTKFAGGGSLAHEWGHFLDNIVASVNGVDPVAGGGVFLSDGHVGGALKSGSSKLNDAVENVMSAILYTPRNAPTDEEYDAKVEEVNEMTGELSRLKRAFRAETNMEKKREIMEKHNALVPAYNRARQTRSDMFQMRAGSYTGKQLMEKNPSRFVTDADAFQSSKNGYWTRPHELFARAFESFIEDELESKNRRNSYLVTGTRKTYDTGRVGKNTPQGEAAQTYPQGDERTRINLAMRQLIETIKSEGMLQKALTYLDQPRFTFSGTIDQLYKRLRHDA